MFAFFAKDSLHTHCSMLVCDSLLASRGVERKQADLSKDHLNK